MTKNLLCFETVCPSKKYFDLCSELKHPAYDIYIFIDDNNYTIDFSYDKDIKVIQIDNKECENSGYRSLVRWMKNKSSSKDKALYYIIKHNLDYKNVWFIEEDCFIPSKNTIVNIDSKYPDYDLLVKDHLIFETKEKSTVWHWSYVYELCKLDPPYGKSLVCTLRCSKLLVDKIKDYVSKYGSLFYCESIFNTLCLHHNLSVQVIKELKYMTWAEYKWNFNKEIKEENIYHPIKNVDIQVEFRYLINKKLLKQTYNNSLL